MIPHSVTLFKGACTDPTTRARCPHLYPGYDYQNEVATEFCLLAEEEIYCQGIRSFKCPLDRHDPDCELTWELKTKESDHD
jgi:hypothetical protein